MIQRAKTLGPNLNLNVYRSHRKLKRLKAIATVDRSDLTLTPDPYLKLTRPFFWRDLLWRSEQNDYISCAVVGAELEMTFSNYVHAI